MATDPPSSALPPGDFQSPLTPPRTTLQTFDPQTSPCLPATHLQLEAGSDHFLQRDSAPYRQEVRPRQIGEDGVGPGQGEGPADPRGFHSFTWQLNNVDDTTRQSSLWPRSFNCFGGLGIPETTPVTHQHPDRSESSPEALPLAHLYTDQLEGCKPWDAHSESPQDFTLTFPAGVYTAGNQSESHYDFQCLVPQGREDQAQHALYPKPIYSYSILIFLALRHSQTGSLPVSQIYRFMTEHFPYFKTAPDGWKNSVRHNLSLNKCFEKVETRGGGMGGVRVGGGASRKGCLWALNPARVEKMQEELHKWRRKDPLTVRKSMARPEELDRLLSDWPERRRLGPTHLPRGPPGFHRHPFMTPPTPTRPHPALRHSLQIPSVGRRPSHIPPSPDSFVYHPPNILEPRLPALPTPTYGAALLAHHCGSTSAQELLTEGALGSDIDTLKPSLTHLPLHGKLWEEVRDDSLAPDTLAAVTTSFSCPPTPNPSLLDGYQGDCTSTTLMDLRVTATFAPSEGVASCLPSSGHTAIALL